MIYLDNNATTQLDPRVFKAMLAEFQGPPANPSSTHFFGKKAHSLLQKVREEIAPFFDAKPQEIIFTSGGTESANLFLRGLKKGHIISSKIEHSCIYKTLQDLDSSVTYVPVNSWGAPLPEDIEKAICKDTSAIVLSASNNETGVKLDMQAISQIAHKHKIPLFIDAVAFIGKDPFIMYPGISAVAISGHKFHGPKGAGILFCRSSLKLNSLITGGPQEQMHRAGTENLAGILGLAEAIKILSMDQTKITEHLHDLRGHLEHGLKQELQNIFINGEGPRVSNTSNIVFEGVDAETLLIQLDMNGIAASHGSACASGALEPSRVLTEMGIPLPTVRSSVRFSIGRFNTREEIDEAIQKISAIVRKLRKM